MGIIGQILIGLLMVVGGVLILRYNYQVSNSLPIGFAEQHLGPGGTYLVWKVLSIVIIVAGFSVMFGFYDNILGWMLSPVTNVLSPKPE